MFFLFFQFDHFIYFAFVPFFLLLFLLLIFVITIWNKTFFPAQWQDCEFDFPFVIEILRKKNKNNN